MSHSHRTVEEQAQAIAFNKGSTCAGFVTFCASWSGAIKCSAYRKGEIDYVRIEKTTWYGKGENKLLYDGPIGIDPQDAPADRARASL